MRKEKPIIEVHNLGKQYHLGQIGATTLRESIQMGLQRLLSKNKDQKLEDPHSFWALRDVSFTVQRGEVIGIIGRNGAGKSTLLKILSRITEPTCGRAILRGRAASLLEVGTGFHPELTAIENIYLNGAILGMSRAEVRAKLDEILAFAGVEKFADTPVKRFSSGMYVRLAFAVAAHLEPEILVVDEVLAVGDAEFQKKALGKMKDVSSSEGRTVLFVSHNMGSMKKLCGRGILLSRGRLVLDSSMDAVVEKYLSELNPAKDSAYLSWDSENAPGDEITRLCRITLENSSGVVTNQFETDEDITVRIEFECLQPEHSFRFSLHLYNAVGDHIFTTVDSDSCSKAREPTHVGKNTRICTIPANLLNAGSYYLGIDGGVFGKKSIFKKCPLIHIQLHAAKNYLSDYPEQRGGVIAPLLSWQ